MDTEELNRILRRLNRNKPRFGNSIEESDSDDPEFRKFQEINQEQEDRAFHQKTYDEDEESDNDLQSSEESFESQLSDSDCDS